ncbi:MAG: hypothetical protein M0Z54_06895 [Thermaerobacter sp.]|nr:hypothetical protein [Thermaerobacter sp.]
MTHAASAAAPLTVPRSAATDAPKRRRRAWGLVIVLAAVMSALVLLTQQPTPAFPPASGLQRLGLTVTPAPATAISTLDTQEVISAAASTDGLGGPEGSPRLVQLTMPGYAGWAWEVASNKGYLQEGQRLVSGRWEIIF